MKRIIICLMLLTAMLAGMMSVHAAEAEITVQVRASKTEVQVGDTVEYTVLATGSGVVAMQFNLQLPEGLRYVPNSGKTPENLAQKLGVPSADWTEQSMMFTFYNDIGITFAQGTEILSFSCVAEKEGDWTVNLYELLPFDGEFMEFTPKLQVQEVTVTDAQTQTSAPSTGETLPVVPDETQSTKPAPDYVEKETQPVSEPDYVEEETLTDTATENTEQTQDDPISAETEDVKEDLTQNRETEETATKSNLPWMILVGAVMLVLCGAIILVIIKKNRT